ncbi:hypothetical protein BDP55DRAFT_672028 [Colletotrichum godetiae]|uniref:Uncharacterized protein n=1 Tax=Colletotrichum godetiae TaxID=1209918 RepID=A0AAJ0AGL1_9PEZI|nr:uncharacterized protein BDP55DRAFT_672028 [Colletotrichum godetiae]KAK1672869.1 hypothetical protein BDP55DRAFT_672028 [Colletotrichum godetiae]
MAPLDLERYPSMVLRTALGGLKLYLLQRKEQGEVHCCSHRLGSIFLPQPPHHRYSPSPYPGPPRAIDFTAGAHVPSLSLITWRVRFVADLLRFHAIPVTSCQLNKSPRQRETSFQEKDTKETEKAHKPPVRAGPRGPAYVRRCVPWLSSAGGSVIYYPFRPCGRLPQLQQATASCCTLPIWATDDAGRTEREAGPVHGRRSRKKDTDETSVDASLQTGIGTDFSGGLRKGKRDR